MEKNNQKTYWPHMIVGFLMLAFSLSFWTVKSASSLPVQEVNQYMLKYQEADININEIMTLQKKFDGKYTIQIMNIETMVMTDNIHSNRPQPDVIKLSKGANHFSYVVKSKSGSIISDAKVSFLLTQPHSVREDVMLEKVAFSEGLYKTSTLTINKAGRYTLQLRVTIGDLTGYLALPAYLKP